MVALGGARHLSEVGTLRLTVASRGDTHGEVRHHRWWALYAARACAAGRSSQRRGCQEPDSETVGFRRALLASRHGNDRLIRRCAQTRHPSDMRDVTI